MDRQLGLSDVYLHFLKITEKKCQGHLKTEAAKGWGSPKLPPKSPSPVELLSSDDDVISIGESNPFDSFGQKTSVKKGKHNAQFKKKHNSTVKTAPIVNKDNIICLD